MIEAQYTTLYKDWLFKVHHKTFPGGLIVTNADELYIRFNAIWQNQDMTNALLDMLNSVYKYYEIGDNDEMFQFMYDTFCEYSTYYKEIIDNYTKEYDYALNNKRTMYKTDELNMVGNTKIDTENSGSSTDYQLPNKVIDEERYRSTPSSITDNDNKGSSDKKYDNNTTRVSEHVTEFNNEFIDLKNKYMNQIRNVYHEFAMKFKDCFYQIY